MLFGTSVYCPVRRDLRCVAWERRWFVSVIARASGRMFTASAGHRHSRTHASVLTILHTLVHGVKTHAFHRWSDFWCTFGRAGRAPQHLRRRDPSAVLS